MTQSAPELRHNCTHGEPRLRTDRLKPCPLCEREEEIQWLRKVLQHTLDENATLRMKLRTLKDTIHE